MYLSVQLLLALDCTNSFFSLASDSTSWVVNHRSKHLGISRPLEDFLGLLLWFPAPSFNSWSLKVSRCMAWVSSPWMRQFGEGKGIEITVSFALMVSIALSLFNMRIWCKNSGFYEIYKMIEWMGTIED